MDTLAERLRVERAKKDISQKMVSIKLGVGQSNVSAWEKGIKNPTLLTLINLADLYGTTTDYLLGRTDNPLSIVPRETPFVEVEPFEKELLEAYRRTDKTTQANIALLLRLTTPAAERAKAKQA